MQAQAQTQRLSRAQVGSYKERVLVLEALVTTLEAQMTTQEAQLTASRQVVAALERENQGLKDMVELLKTQGAPPAPPAPPAAPPVVVVPAPPLVVPAPAAAAAPPAVAVSPPPSLYGGLNLVKDWMGECTSCFDARGDILVLASTAKNMSPPVTRNYKVQDAAGDVYAAVICQGCKIWKLSNTPIDKYTAVPYDGRPLYAW